MRKPPAITAETRCIEVGDGGLVFVRSLVQVVDPNHPMFGLAIIVGDFTDFEIHGFYTGPRERHFVTVPASVCKYVGESHIKTNTPCSREWMKLHPESQTTPTTNEERNHLRHRDPESDPRQENPNRGGD